MEVSNQFNAPDRLPPGKEPQPEINNKENTKKGKARKTRRQRERRDRKREI
jgi:hypothetical protein